MKATGGDEKKTKKDREGYWEGEIIGQGNGGRIWGKEKK